MGDNVTGEDAVRMIKAYSSQEKSVGLKVDPPCQDVTGHFAHYKSIPQHQHVLDCSDTKHEFLRERYDSADVQ